MALSPRSRCAFRKRSVLNTLYGAGMTTDAAQTVAASVIDWLLDSDPAIRRQVLRDLTDASPGEIAAERARVEREGWGARLYRRLLRGGRFADRRPDPRRTAR
jgi:hypothetical protein